MNSNTIFELTPMRLKFHITTFLALVFFLSAPAQSSVTVKSFALTTDHIPGNDRRNDLNGVPCALVKVFVVDDIERVEGNPIGDIVKRGNVEKWVYICKGSRNIRLHLKNHLPVRVMFQDYQINGLESNRVYELYLEIPNMPVPPQPETPDQPIVVQQDTPTYTGNDSAMEKQYEPQTPGDTQPSAHVMPPRPLNKSFKINYGGVTFKCKAKKGFVTITGFDTNAGSVTIPGKVEFEGEYYPVREIDTFINGNNYAAASLVIEEGVESIANFAFVEFRKLVDVTIPSTIKEIGKNAFRDNSGMRFNAPSNISLYDLRGGRSIRVR